MIRIRFATTGCFCVFCVCLPLLGACAAPGPSPLNFCVTHMQDADRSAVFQAAEDALLGFGYRIDRREPAAGLLTTYPVEGAVRDESARGRTRLGTPRPMRRIAKVRIEERTGEVTVYCKVAVQEQTTEAYRMREYDLRTSDTPGYTPIDRDAATTKAQNTVWRTIRRDKRAERQILTAIEQRTGG